MTLTFTPDPNNAAFIDIICRDERIGWICTEHAVEWRILGSHQHQDIESSGSKAMPAESVEAAHAAAIAFCKENGPQP